MDNYNYSYEMIKNGYKATVKEFPGVSAVGDDPLLAIRNLKNILKDKKSVDPVGTLLPITEAMQDIHRTSKKLKNLYFSCQEEEADGYLSTDVSSLYLYKGVWDFLKSNLETFFSVYKEIGFFRSLKVLNFNRTVDFWAFVVDSRESLKYDLAMIRLRRKKSSYENLQKELDLINDGDLEEFILINHVKVNDFLYINKGDASCIVFDERTYPYEKEKGFSKHQVKAILENWYYFFFKEAIEAKLIQ